MFKKSEMYVRAVVPVRSASHGIRIAQTLNRLYSGVASVVSGVDHSTLIDFEEIRRIVLSEEQAEVK
jgi:hypothetical protein